VICKEHRELPDGNIRRRTVFHVCRESACKAFRYVTSVIIVISDHECGRRRELIFIALNYSGARYGIVGNRRFLGRDSSILNERFVSFARRITITLGDLFDDFARISMQHVFFVIILPRSLGDRNVIFYPLCQRSRHFAGDSVLRYVSGMTGMPNGFDRFVDDRDAVHFRRPRTFVLFVRLKTDRRSFRPVLSAG